MKLSIIACVGKNLELGKNNDLLWHLKDDLRYFKEVTLNHAVVMGKNTFESLPGILKDRKNIVLTKESQEKFPLEVEVFHSIEDFLEAYKNFREEIFIIGGASIYKQFLDKCDTLYLTEVNASSDADVYFPSFDKNFYQKEIIKENKEKGITYQHVIYRRK